MKTFKLNGFDVVVCCDPMHVDLANGKYYINEPMLDDDWPECFGLCCIGEGEPLGECEHCEREVIIK